MADEDIVKALLLINENLTELNKKLDRVIGSTYIPAIGKRVEFIRASDDAY